MSTTNPTDQPTSDLVRELAEQTSRLARQEVELAKAELTQKGKKAGMGAGMFGGAGIFAWFGFGALTTAFILALATAVAAWLAAAIVAVLYFAVAGVLGLLGRSKTQEATPLAPERAAASVKADVQTTKARVKEARS